MSALRKLVRRLIPLAARQALAHARRRWHDVRHGVRLSEARGETDLSGFTLHVELSQAVMPGAMLENKLANLARGAQRINLALLAPRQTWSFWRYVRRPSERNGFVAGRNLVNGQLTRQIGGGLCQLSSLAYHLGLLSGLVVVERHPHSIDIYREHERFTPLGADATVVWGFKDLRLSNPHGVDVLLECYVQEQRLIGRVYARGPLPNYDIDFVREQIGANQVVVDTVVNRRQHTRTRYEQQPGLSLEASGA